ncbi:TnsA endonuclease N-terminal domain-containing protein [Aquitalea magnusonii]|uniref:TnsA endonuclease N-terminal domain-containing protein n=1 Tax=Aquitalea magnusonii TaxID=332411 RepID=UPI000B5C8F92|nr:TnsA endonuclease N-terminal domain-containing protein [Aquitalea magnusonii]
MLIPSIRKIHNVNSSKVIGLSYSFKMAGLIPWESTLERDWLLHLESNLAIREIYGQPETFDYCYQGKWHRYTPDFKACWHDPNRLPTLYEVKPHDVASSDVFRQQSDCIRQALAMYGYEYVVKDEYEIRQQPVLNNLNFLKHYADMFVSRQDQVRILDAFDGGKAYRLQWLLAQLGCNTTGLAKLYHLIWRGWLDYDEHHAITPLLEVWLVEGAW